MKWTEQQARAIELKNKNILVAAAAGSGKTAVLVERIKRLILEERCPIDRMLIVTFTNAAASEMKEKIEKAIRKTIAETASKDDLVFLKRQLDLLPAANISTFHAFALEVIRRYFYITDIEPDFKICDGSQQTILRQQALDMLLEQRYETNEPEFIAFLNKFSGDRNDNKLRKMIEEAFDTIQSLPEPYQWLDGAVSGLDCTEEEFINSPAFMYIMETIREDLAKIRPVMEENIRWTEANNLEGALSLAQQDMVIFGELEKACMSGDYNKTAAALETFKLPVMSKKYFDPASNSGDSLALSAAKEYLDGNRSVLKDWVSAAKKTFFYDTPENLADEVRSTAADGLYFAGLVKDFAALYDLKKKEKKLADFSDIEHYAYEILKDPEVSGFYRNKFNHIFIDEYQDSNVIQEALVNSIRRENNLFMVGDVKQSIYKFRLAEPEIFQRKYREFALEMAEKGEASLSEKIDLNRNFRSKAPVINFINNVFSEIMAGYDDAAALYLGDPYGEECPYKPKLYLAETFWSEEDQPDEELKTLIKAEKEALAAVRIIKDALGKPFFDSKQEIWRPLEKKDIVILMRGVRNYGDLFYKILTENNLPAYVDDNDGFFDTLEINTFMSLLAIIDNEKQDIPLLTVMRSEILNFSIEEMAAIRIAFRKGSYYSALASYAEGGQLPQLKAKCISALESIASWKELCRILPLEELVWELMISTGFYIAAGAMPAGSQRQANLRALVDKAAGWRKSQDGSLYGFIRYIDAVKEKKVPMGQVKMAGEDEDTVRIMTIHKSKGLEFPMVLLAGYCRKLNYTAAGKGITIHKDLGIGFPLINYEQSWYRTTILQNVINHRMHREEVEEEKRILYVAMTRARDILNILGIMDDVAGGVEKILSQPSKDSSYFSMTGGLICGWGLSWEEITNSQLTGISRARRRQAGRIVSIMEDKPVSVSEDILARLTFSYPAEDDLYRKSKYSVSELAFGDYRGGGHGESHVSSAGLMRPSFMAGNTGFTAAQTGTFTHKVLEKMDFGRAAKEGAAYIASLVENMIADQFLTAEEGGAVDIGKLADFARSPLGQRIAASPAVYREKPFNIVYEVDGKEVLVQGIIDCFFEEDGQLVLADYKTSNIKDKDEFERRRGEIAERYRLQMDIYRRALEESRGMKVKEANLVLTNISEIIKM